MTRSSYPINRKRFCVALVVMQCAQIPSALAAIACQHPSLWDSFIGSLVSNFGTLLVATIAVALGYTELRSRLIFDKRKFEADENDRTAMQRFRTVELSRFSETSKEIGETVSKGLANNPDWARQALEA